MKHLLYFKNIQAEAQILGFICACLCDIEIKTPASESVVHFDKRFDAQELTSLPAKIRFTNEKDGGKGLVNLAAVIRTQAIVYIEDAVRKGRLFCRLERFGFWGYLEDAPLETLGRLVAMVTDKDAPNVYGFSTLYEYDLDD